MCGVWREEGKRVFCGGCVVCHGIWGEMIVDVEGGGGWRVLRCVLRGNSTGDI